MLRENYFYILLPFIAFVYFSGFGFINAPEQRRNALSNKIDAVDKMISVNNTFGAEQKLQHDIRDKVEKWIVDYIPQNVLQLSKGFILDLIDKIISRLS